MTKSDHPKLQNILKYRDELQGWGVRVTLKLKETLRVTKELEPDV